MLKITKISILALLSFLALRGSTLEYFDLSEPTEARYAAIAADMIGLNDWVIPQFPRGMDHEPYLGKPPLYFWLVALSQLVFGFDEWTARLPSYLSLIGILGLTFISGSQITYQVALSSMLILCGTAYVYFFSGSVMMDITLALWICSSLVSFQKLNSKIKPLTTKSQRGYLVLFWLGAALGFLTKGPVAIIFTFLPIVSFLIQKKDFAGFKELLWIPGILLFFLLTVPWFIMAEMKNPGFMHYFFVHENFLRFFVKNYGDRYGSGHRYPYGSVIWMLLVGFLPWSLYFFRVIPNWKFIKREYHRNSDFQFFICWSFSIPLFLCFMKQLHPGYIIPAFPGIALSLAFLRESDASIKAVEWDILVRRILRYLSYATILTVSGYFLIKKIHFGSIGIFALATLGIIKITLANRQSQWHYYTQLERLSDISIFIFFTFFCLSMIIGRELSESTSPATIYRCIASSAPKYENTPVEVTYVGNRSYTSHFLSEHWQHELSKALTINLSNEPVTDPSQLRDHVVVKAKYASSIPIPEYKKIAQINNFIWYARGSISHDLIPNCEFSLFENAIQ